MTVSVLTGDCREVLQTLPDKYFHCCVTSPPYFGLRDYGNESQIGQEKSPQEYVAELVLVFREVRRVLRDDGTLWLNLGDTYASNPSWGRGGGSSLDGGKQDANGGYSGIDRTKISGVKPKDLIGIPWRVAFALQEDGWYLRQDIIWHKPNPMPESVTDRCTKAHEYIFLLSKSANYYFDHDAIKESAKGNWGSRDREGGKYHKEGTGLTPHGGLTANYATANKRSVWTVPTQPFSGAHFATFPPALIEPCIRAGAPPVMGIVLDPFCGAGTTGLVCSRLGRNATLIELNAEYASMAQQRINDDAPLLALNNISIACLK